MTYNIRNLHHHCSGGWEFKMKVLAEWGSLWKAPERSLSLSLPSFWCLLTILGVSWLVTIILQFLTPFSHHFPLCVRIISDILYKKINTRWIHINMKRFNTYRNKYKRIFVILGWECLNTVQKHKSWMKKVVAFIFFVIKNLRIFNTYYQERSCSQNSQRTLTNW